MAIDETNQRSPLHFRLSLLHSRPSLLDLPTQALRTCAPTVRDKIEMPIWIVDSVAIMYGNTIGQCIFARS
jgi:hypothetical protein